MSAEHMAAVFASSPYTGAAYTVHLCLADTANDGHGNELWLSVKSLAAKARTNEKTVRRVLHQMSRDGALELLEQRAGQTNRYRFVAPTAGVTPAGRQETAGTMPAVVRTSDPRGRHVRAGTRPAVPRTPRPDTADTTPDELKKPKRTQPTRPRDPLWDTFAALVGFQPQTKNEQGAWNGALKQLRDIGATPSDVERAYQAALSRWKNATITLPALVKHWGDLTRRANATEDAGGFH